MTTHREPDCLVDVLEDLRPLGAGIALGLASVTRATMAFLLPLFALDLALMIAVSACQGCKPQPQVVSQR